MKPLGRKNYGSIGHLPSSRMGPADHSCHEGQQRIATLKARDKHDLIIVTEKLDGSNVGIAFVDDHIHALGRAGYLAQSSKYEQHQLFADWVRDREGLWRRMLRPGERLIGEWMAQAHGTRYALPRGPFVAFDMMVGEARLSFAQIKARCDEFSVPMPRILHIGGPLSVDAAMALHGDGDHGLIDEPEGAVWRVERRKNADADYEYDFMAKWVRPDKVDGKLLPEVSGEPIVWNWRPS
jgi:hypothetical protein